MKKSFKIILVVILVWVFSPVSILLINNCQTSMIPDVNSPTQHVIPGHDPYVIALCHSIAFTALPGGFIWSPVYNAIITIIY